MPIEMPSYGESTASTRAEVYDLLSRLSIRDCARPPSQRRVATWLKSLCPLWTTSFFESTYGLSTLIAPWKKKFALLSSGEPANSSTLNGPLPSLRPSFSAM